MFNQVENSYSYKNQHMDIYSSFISNGKNLEQSKYPSVAQWTDCDTSIQESVIQH